MKLPHDGEGVEHSPCCGRVLPPVAAAERHLGHLLACPETIKDRTPWEPASAQLAVDAAAEIGLQVRARTAGRLVYRKISRD